MRRKPCRTAPGKSFWIRSEKRSLSSTTVSKRNDCMLPRSNALSSFLENATLWRCEKTRSKPFSDGWPPKRASPLLRKNKHSTLCCSSAGKFWTSLQIEVRMWFSRSHPFTGERIRESQNRRVGFSRPEYICHMYSILNCYEKYSKSRRLQPRRSGDITRLKSLLRVDGLLLSKARVNLYGLQDWTRDWSRGPKMIATLQGRRL